MRIRSPCWLMALTISFNFLATACAHKERMYEGFYEGLKTHNRVSPEETYSVPAESAPGYRQYKVERKKLLPKPETQ